jgi:dTDP-4-dehydrorhamnose reductase
VKILITGISGQVGQALLASVPAQLEACTFTREQLNITDADAVRRAVATFQPELIINAAAYTAVDKAESEPDLAAAVNTDGPRYLAQAAHAIPDCRLLHISTDYVFDGQATAPYKPTDPTNPLCIYGRTKLLGERAVLETLRERVVVLRTAWVYAARGKNFLLTMLRLMHERGAVRVVADQRGTPTAAESIASTLWAIVQRPRIHGILHWTDAGQATWYEFAVEIAEQGRALGLLSRQVEVTPITTADYPTPAHRPPNSVLDTRESIEQLGLTPLSWRERLRVTLTDMART